jgi:uncharacterized protein YecE (DUF72 family)
MTSERDPTPADSSRGEARLVSAADPHRLALATGLAERSPEPAVTGNVRTGTAGWTDRTLVESGLFYPRSATSAGARLGFYAQHFRLVEVDATYYSLLAPRTAVGWLEHTPSDFIFDIKAFPVFTGHPIDVGRLPADLRPAILAVSDAPRVYPDRLPDELRLELERRFLDSVEPLRAAGRLGCVMAQFPPWFAATRGNARRLENLRRRLGDLPVSVEFRHRSWLQPERRERLLGLLRAQEFFYVCVDEPEASVGGVPPVALVGDPRLSLVRFHGRNRAGWEKPGATVHERFDYLYAPDELGFWIDPIRRLAGRAETVHAIFNNCLRNYAVVGAKGMAALLVERP